jgi:DNA mismatch repair protein MutS
MVNKTHNQEKKQEPLAAEQNGPINGSVNDQMSPLMRQYWDIKSQYPDVLVFFRVGDFYELFDLDAQVASRELDITLTGRPDAGYPNGRVPMAGVPCRSVDLYLGKLILKGYSVAICEQVGVVGAGKGPVERQVTRIVTPGTVLESNLLPARENNYLVALTKSQKDENKWGLAYVDASCGEFSVTELTDEQVVLEMGRLNPKEVLVAKRTVKVVGQVMPQDILEIPPAIEGLYRFKGRPAMFFQLEPSARRIQQFFEISTLEGFGIDDMPLAIQSSGAILEYLEQTQAALMPRFAGIAKYNVDGHLVLDVNTRKNLELTETSRDRGFEGSLLWAIDRTKTGMGSRALRRWLLKPLFDLAEIGHRQQSIAELMDNYQLRQAVSSGLAQLSDLERLAVKLSSGTVNPKDLVAIRTSLEVLPELANKVVHCVSPLLSCIGYLPEELVQLRQKIERALLDDPSRELTEGGILREGYNAELDEIRGLLGGGRQWLEEFQQREQERTGIKSLKVNFNQNFGYFIEITHSNKDAVPADYIRKQTLTNAERYITPELKEYEAKILNAEKNQSGLEYKLFVAFRKELVAFGPKLNTVASNLATLDALLSLTDVAIEGRYVCPVVDDSTTLEIINGRHPVLERILPMGKFVANDTKLVGQSEDHQLVILTGPNMSGKSSYLRQVAHIVLLAQMGSFVPADSARVGIVDRIFTRIGAVDDLTQGQSTFLVEMSETTQCCLAATNRSLVLLDEVGRGTSTYDGVAIAWSVAEYLATTVRSRTIFATHYHELNGLAGYFPQIVNYQVLVKEVAEHIEFMRRVVPGAASRSFGVQVARMAGLPQSIIDRAQYLMSQMERKGAAPKIAEGPKMKSIDMDEVMQLSLFSPGNKTNAELATGSKK